MISAMQAAIAARRLKVDSTDDSTTGGVGLGLGVARSGPTAPPDSVGKPRSPALGAHAGLSNQGATCYLNSLLQTLYACEEFRLQVFASRGGGPVTGALQALFAELLLGARGAASTRALTKAFGWEDGEAYEQHDASEALVVVLDALQREAREEGGGAGAVAEASSVAAAAGLRHANLGAHIAAAHTGGMVLVTTCRGCGTARSRADTFLALLLPVRGSGGSVHGALREMAAEEALCGDNQYACETCNGKRDAGRRVRLTALPEQLLLHLNRHEYDLVRRARRKVEDAVVPCETLDVAPYCAGVDEEGGGGGWQRRHGV